MPNVQPTAREIIAPFDSGSSDGGVAGDGRLSDGEVRNQRGGYEALEAKIGGSTKDVRTHVFDCLDDLAKLGVAGAKLQRGGSATDYLANLPDPYDFIAASHDGKALAATIETFAPSMIDEARASLQNSDPVGSREALAALGSLRIGLAEHSRFQAAHHERASRELHETADWWNRESVGSSPANPLRPAWRIGEGTPTDYSAESATVDAIPALDDRSVRGAIAELDAAVAKYREALAFDDPSHTRQAEQALDALGRRLASASVAPPLKGRILATSDKRHQRSFLGLIRINRDSTVQTRVARESNLTRAGTVQFG